LEIVDEHLSRFFNEPKWGYSVPYFIAAINNCHPNYASYLMNKQTISVKSINTILRQIPNKKRDIFNENYIEDLYISHQMQLVDDTENLKRLRKLIGNKKVLIVAPGKSIKKELENIKTFINEEDPFIISINFLPSAFNCNAIFISNSKRFKSMEDVIKDLSFATTLITTSNITNLKVDSSIVVNYSDLLLENSLILDNAGLMAINLLNRLFIDHVYLGGFDGFSLNKAKNYYSTDLINHIEMVELVKKNEEIKSYLANVEKHMGIHYVTSTIYKDDYLYSKTY
jgi:4-hydroxy 2-oxovalerate aldolase